MVGGWGRFLQFEPNVEAIPSESDAGYGRICTAQHVVCTHTYAAAQRYTRREHAIPTPSPPRLLAGEGVGGEGRSARLGVRDGAPATPAAPGRVSWGDRQAGERP